jgi:SAM-dependent methyltransferase
MPEWHEQDEFWEALEGWLFDEERLSETPREVSEAIGLLGLEPRARILDLCCGPGRHSIELARRGYRVVGVDRTARYLEAARRRTAEEGLSIEFVAVERREYTFTHRLYSGTELAESLRRAGFEPVSLYGSLAGRPYDETAETLVAVAEKGGPRHE